MADDPTIWLAYAYMCLCVLRRGSNYRVEMSARNHTDMATLFAIEESVALLSTIMIPTGCGRVIYRDMGGACFVPTLYVDP